MEVFSLKVEDKSTGDKIVSGQGVVYCEMKSRQNSEADLMDYNIRRQLCHRFGNENPAVFSRFKYECGGLTKDIATLSIAEILDFHNQFYNPSNISIIICGKMNDELEEKLLSLVASVLKPSENYGQHQKFIPSEPEVVNLTGSCTAFFPSNEENLGSIGFAWLGTPARDLIKVLSFHVIFKYLRETSSSPLYQQFVQIENPWATDIDYDIKPFYHTFMTLVFSGVPYDRLEPHKLRSVLMEYLVSISKDVEEFERMIKFCLSAFELKLIELIEDDPYETIVSYTVPDIIVATIDDSLNLESFGRNISSLKRSVSYLKSQSIEYWLSHLSFLAENEPVEVIMKPSAKLDNEIETEEKEFLLELWRTEKARIAEIPEIPPYKIEGNFELMTDSQVTPFSKSFSYEGLHLVELPGTGMKQILRLINFKTFIPDDLWSYLVLYQELLFQCDVDLISNPEIKQIIQFSDDKISYQLLQKILNSKFNSYGINFGIENDTFSVGYCEEAMTWSVTLPSSSEISLKECISILEVIATSSIFTSDRIKIIAENLYNQIQDLQKDSYEIIESILTVTLHEMDKSTSNVIKKAKIIEDQGKVFENSISMFNQKGFLKRISRGDSEVIEETLKCLEMIKENVKEGLKNPSFIQIGSKASILKEEALKMSSLEVELRKGRDNFDISKLPKFGHLSIDSVRGFAYSIGDITASYLSFVIPCNVLPSDKICLETIKEYVSISLICQLLSVTEGPIYSAIRGRGLAYDASLTISLWNGLLTFAVNDSNDPVNAFKEFQKLMQTVDQEFKNEKWNIISQDSLKVAKSAFLYQMIEETATPASMFNSCLRNYLRSIPMASSSKEIDPIMEVVLQVKESDLAQAWFKHFPSLLSGSALAVLVVPKSISENVLDQFKGLIDFELKTFNDFAAEYFVESGDISGSDCEDEDESETDGDCEDESDTEAESDADSSTLNDQ